MLVHHKNGTILLPGGHVELVKDSAALYPTLEDALFAGLKREIQEELGIDDVGWDIMDVPNNFRPNSVVNWENDEGFCFDFVGNMPWNSEITVVAGSEIVEVEWIDPRRSLEVYAKQMPDNI